MSQPYLGEIRIFAGNFAPAGWSFCEGQLLLISENDALFTLIGTTYGGDGQTTFGLPDLRGRVPIHAGTGSGLSTYQLGQTGGQEAVTLTTQQIPGHGHPLGAGGGGATSTAPGGLVPAQSQSDAFASGFSARLMRADAIAPVGGSQPHENLQPYQCINFIISRFGIYPSQA